MSDSMHNPAGEERVAQLRRLFSAYADGQLSDAEQQELTALLRDDASLRSEYFRLTTLHALLHIEAKRGAVGMEEVVADSLLDKSAAAPGVMPPAPSSPAAPSAPTNSVLPIVTAWINPPIALGALLGIAILGAASWFMWSGGATPKVVVPEVPVAYLTRTIDVVWAAAGQSPPAEANQAAAVLKPGTSGPRATAQPLSAGRRLQLASGLAEIEFASGAKVVLQGPADLIVGSKSEVGGRKSEGSGAGPTPASQARNSARLTYGKLTAHVPHQAIGFTVVSPTATVVDQGTEFGMFVRSEIGGRRSDAALPTSDLRPPTSTEVHVLTGRVEVAPTLSPTNSGSATKSEISNPKSEILQAGHAVLVSPAAGGAPAAVTSIPAVPGEFVRSLPPQLLMADNFESYTPGSTVNGLPGWRLYYGHSGQGGDQSARIVDLMGEHLGSCPASIFGRHAVELRDEYANPRFANPILEGALADGNLTRDLLIQFDFRRMGKKSLPLFTLQNCPWRLLLGPELTVVTDSAAAPLATIEPGGWYRLALRVPSSPHGGQLQVRLEHLVQGQFVEPVSGEFAVAGPRANDKVHFAFVTKTRQAAGGVWQIDNIHVELADDAETPNARNP